jgi:hypothetical protein
MASTGSVADDPFLPFDNQFCCDAQRGATESSLGIAAWLPYSGFRLAALTTLAHFSVCSARCFPNSEGEATKGKEPSSASRAFSFASARPALIFLFSSSTISALVLLGAQTPYQALAS